MAHWLIWVEIRAVNIRHAHAQQYGPQPSCEKSGKSALEQRRVAFRVHDVARVRPALHCLLSPRRCCCCCCLWVGLESTRCSYAPGVKKNTHTRTHTEIATVTADARCRSSDARHRSHDARQQQHSYTDTGREGKYCRCTQRTTWMTANHLTL